MYHHSPEVRRLVNFVRRSCAISSKAVKSRNKFRLDELKLRLRRFLRRDLTPREEYLLELSEPILKSGADRTEEDSEAA